MEKRQHPRWNFREPVGYHFKEDDPDAGSLSKDISQGGVRIRVQEFIPLRTVLNLKLRLTNPAREVPVKGQVVWVREVPHSEMYDIGIQFVVEGGRTEGTSSIGDFLQSKEKEESSN